MSKDGDKTNRDQTEEAPRARSQTEKVGSPSNESKKTESVTEQKADTASQVPVVKKEAKVSADTKEIVSDSKKTASLGILGKIPSAQEDEQAEKKITQPIQLEVSTSVFSSSNRGIGGSADRADEKKEEKLEERETKSTTILTGILFLRQLKITTLLLAKLAETYRPVERCFYTRDKYKNTDYLISLCENLINNMILFPSKYPPIYYNNIYDFNLNLQKWVRRGPVKAVSTPIKSEMIQRYLRKLKKLNQEYQKSCPRFTKLYWERQIRYYNKSIQITEALEFKDYEKLMSRLIVLFQKHDKIVPFNAKNEDNAITTANLIFQKMLAAENLTDDLAYDLILTTFVGRDISYGDPRTILPIVMDYIEKFSAICLAIYYENKIEKMDLDMPETKKQERRHLMRSNSIGSFTAHAQIPHTQMWMTGKEQKRFNVAKKYLETKAKAKPKIKLQRSMSYDQLPRSISLFPTRAVYNTNLTKEQQESIMESRIASFNVKK